MCIPIGEQTISVIGSRYPCYIGPGIDVKGADEAKIFHLSDGLDQLSALFGFADAIGAACWRTVLRDINLLRGVAILNHDAAERRAGLRQLGPS